MKSTIRLFKALPIKFKGKKKASNNLLKETITKGFVFSPEVIHNYSENELLNLTKDIGLSPEQMNSSFHKSWQKIKEASIEQLVVEQIIHYITTYGFEKLDIYDKSSVYIPNEKLEIPKVKESISLTIIKGYTTKELKEKLLNLLSFGVALKEDTINDIVDVALFVELDEDEIEQIKNKETKIIMYHYLDIIPKNPVEFLRYAVYQATEKTLLIKSPELITVINSGKNISIAKLFQKYDKKYGLLKLAEIFYRFKPLFLAFRTNSQLKIIVNKIRRLAAKHHKPMPEDYLNTITAKIKNNTTIDKEKLGSELNRVNVFRKIRLAYALKYRTKDVESILYRIRNGKGYATKFEFSNRNSAQATLDVILDSIIKDIRKNVKGKKIYIPENIEYTLPATEKQFTDNVPSGSYVSIPKDMIMGVYWDNVGGHRIDLDLSMMAPSTGKIGWDSSYRTEDKNILFSGDMTDANKGASELFYVRKQKKDAFIVFVNYFNYDSSVEVPFKIIVAQENVINLKKNYMVNPNNVISLIESKINKQQKILGLLVTRTDKCRFYFTEADVGKSITASAGSDFVEHSRKYLFSFYENTIGLKDILVKAGAKIVNDNKKCDIDLSLNMLEKDSILKLII